MEEKPAEQKPRIFVALPPPAASPQGAQPEPSREAWPTKPARPPPRENHAENLTKTSRIPPPEPPRKPPRKPARKPPRKPPENQPEYLSNTWLLFVLLNGAVPWGWGPKLVFGRFSGGFRVGFRLGFRAPSGRRPPRRFVEDHAYDAGAAGGLASSFPRRDGRSTHKHRRDRLASTISLCFRSAGFSSMGSLML